MRALFHAIRAGGMLLWLICAAINIEAQSLASGVLTNISQIRNLTLEQAAKAFPVHLSGVVVDTSADFSSTAMVVADQTTGIYVQLSKNVSYHWKDWLEITGVTAQGQFAPVVMAQEVRKLGTNDIPAALPITHQQLITGALASQWVEIKGVVRQCFKPAPGSDIWRIVIAMDGGLVPVRYSTKSGGEIQADTEVRVQAVCFYQYNQKRQALHPVLQVPREVSLVVEKPAPADPYAAPVRSASSLSTFMPENLHTFAHRVHVRGVVTYSQPGSFVWIRDEASGLRIQTSQQENLAAGDKIDVLGFPTFGSYSPMLEYAILRKTGYTSHPHPLTLTNFDEAFNHEDDLVTMEGILTQVQLLSDGLVLTLDGGGKTFKAVLNTPVGGPAHPDWEAGSKVRITGICSLIHDETRPFAGMWQPKSFQLLLRSSADLITVKPSPWWTLKHITILLSIVIGLLVLIISLVVILSRRRLHEQERDRKMAEHEFTAILSERNRLAREIHDTLAQGLGAISMQLELVKDRLALDSNGAGEHLDQAHQLVRTSLADARNSIWNMRSQVLETGDLGSALTGILQQLAGDTGVIGRMQVTGSPRRLPPVTENNLLRIGQEAITNAMKHAQAKLIEVELEFADKEVRLRVKDDGRGFNLEPSTTIESGFGLRGMRERVEELHGKLKLQSTPGRGTEIALAVPVAG